MSLPRLNADDVGAIKSLAAIIQVRKANDLDYTLLLGGANVDVGRAGEWHPPRALADTELRGSFDFAKNKMYITCNGKTFDVTSDYALKHIGRTLAHEATHFVQNHCFADDEKRDAEARGKAYARSRLATDYAAYISHPVELPAHASMIAFDRHSTAISDQDFSVFATTNSWSYDYFKCKLADAPNAQTILDNLVAEAECAYGAM